MSSSTLTTFALTWPRQGFSPNDLRYVNHGHGVPSYFYIEFIDNLDEDIAEFCLRWGRPYSDDGIERISMSVLGECELIEKN